MVNKEEQNIINMTAVFVSFETDEPQSVAM